MGKNFFIGTSGYVYKHWRGRFYPDDLPETAWFSHYAKVFNTVEINYSFYQWPTKETIENWREQAPTGFKYSLKAPRTFTHVRRLKNISGKLSELYELTDSFGRKKGCHLFQLPPSFTLDDTNLARLQAFVAALDGRRDNAIEFRDASCSTKITLGSARSTALTCHVISYRRAESRTCVSMASITTPATRTTS